jgi:hypothetical protein
VTDPIIDMPDFRLTPSKDTSDPSPLENATLKAAIDKASQLPANQVTIEAVDENGHAGAEAGIEKNFTVGKGEGSIGAEGSWLQGVGYRAAAIFGFKWGAK